MGGGIYEKDMRGMCVGGGDFVGIIFERFKEFVCGLDFAFYGRFLFVRCLGKYFRELYCVERVGSVRIAGRDFGIVG